MAARVAGHASRRDAWPLVALDGMDLEPCVDRVVYDLDTCGATSAADGPGSLAAAAGAAAAAADAGAGGGNKKSCVVVVDASSSSST